MCLYMLQDIVSLDKVTLHSKVRQLQKIIKGSIAKGNTRRNCSEERYNKSVKSLSAAMKNDKLDTIIDWSYLLKRSVECSKDFFAFKRDLTAWRLRLSRQKGKGARFNSSAAKTQGYECTEQRMEVRLITNLLQSRWSIFLAHNRARSERTEKCKL